MEASASGSQSLERGLAILAEFRPATPELGISDLARCLGLSRSTSHRYVATLARLGYLQQNEDTRKYRLGPRVLDLGFAAINSMELRQISAPHLQKLADETGHTVNMAILDGTDIVYIERCRTSQPGQREIDLDLHVGSRLPAYCTSMGKVLLAYLPPGRRAEILDRSSSSTAGRTRSRPERRWPPSSSRSARSGSRSTTRSWPTASARSPCPSGARTGRRSPQSTSPSTARRRRSATSSTASARRCAEPPQASRRSSATGPRSSACPHGSAPAGRQGSAGCIGAQVGPAPTVASWETSRVSSAREWMSSLR